MSQWDKLAERVQSIDNKLRFDEIVKVLKKIGYTQNQPKGGSSHYTFRKQGFPPITIPKSEPIKKAYVELVRDALTIYLAEVNTDD